MSTLDITVIGIDGPGRTFFSNGRPLTNVHAALQVRAEPVDPVPGDTREARWTTTATLRHREVGEVTGPGVHGRPGARFLYVTWGEVTDRGFEMFRRAKVMLDGVPADVWASAIETGRGLEVRVPLADEKGGPACAALRPPRVTWTVAEARHTDA